MSRYSKRVAIATVLVAGATATSAWAVPPPPDSTFSGDTSQTNVKNHQVDIQTDSNGHVSAFAIDWRAKCKRKGKSWTAGTTIQPGGDGLQMDGEIFGADGSYNSKVNRKIKGVVTVSLRGTFVDNDNAQGTWKASVKVLKKNKKGKFKKFDSCKADITWSAARTG